MRKSKQAVSPKGPEVEVLLPSQKPPPLTQEEQAARAARRQCQKASKRRKNELAVALNIGEAPWRLPWTPEEAEKTKLLGLERSGVKECRVIPRDVVSRGPSIFVVVLGCKRSGD